MRADGGLPDAVLSVTPFESWCSRLKTLGHERRYCIIFPQSFVRGLRRWPADGFATRVLHRPSADLAPWSRPSRLGGRRGASSNSLPHSTNIAFVATVAISAFPSRDEWPVASRSSAHADRIHRSSVGKRPDDRGCSYANRPYLSAVILGLNHGPVAQRLTKTTLNLSQDCQLSSALSPCVLEVSTAGRRKDRSHGIRRGLAPD